MVTGKERYGERVFSKEQSTESARLGAITRTYDPSTEALLTRLGVGPGWSCADVGCGVGSVAGWLAARAAPGPVVAVDRDLRLLDEALSQYDNLRVAQADVTAEHPELGQFDLVHARFLVMHLRQRDEVLARLATWVEPGGWLVISDSIDLTTAGSGHLPYRHAMAAMWRTLHEVIGTDIGWVRDTPRLLRQAGLEDVGTEIYLPSADHRSSVARFWSTTWSRWAVSSRRSWTRQSRRWPTRSSPRTRRAWSARGVGDRRADYLRR
jgi:2-polyprenyl-3-methyl-5-hydroxy-6-metoxy-1,4-benzoquinol methylase